MRGETAKELSKLSGLSKNDAGPALAGVYDKTNGKYYFAINEIDGNISSKLHFLIEDRIKNMPDNIANSYIRTKGVGSHAEVNAINEALLANPNAKIENLTVHVVRSGKKLKPAGQMMKRCPHCEYITEGIEFISEVPKNVK